MDETQMRNPLPNPFIDGEINSFLHDTQAFMAAAVLDLPAIDEPEAVQAAPAVGEPVHRTHAAEFERYDLDALSRQLKTKLAARVPESERAIASFSQEER